jgi:hypothetical protein
MLSDATDCISDHHDQGSLIARFAYHLPAVIRNLCRPPLLITYRYGSEQGAGESGHPYVYGDESVREKI